MTAPEIAHAQLPPDPDVPPRSRPPARGVALIGALAVLLVCQLAGETAVRLTGLPVPGPVLGMVLLTGILVARDRVPRELEETALGLLRHLSLLFVPAGVGVMLHGERIGGEGPALAAALLASTALTIAVSAVTFRLVARLVARLAARPASRDGSGSNGPGSGGADAGDR